MRTHGLKNWGGTLTPEDRDDEPDPEHERDKRIELSPPLQAK